MAESHSKGEQRHRPLATAAADSGNGRQFRPYAWKDANQEPPAVTAARERHRALNAEIERRAQAAEAMPDPAPGYEWYRELADEQGGAP